MKFIVVLAFFAQFFLPSHSQACWEILRDFDYLAQVRDADFGSDRKYGVGVALIWDGKILMGKRLSSAGEGTWGLPGGAWEVGETLEGAARRELMEETGVRVGEIRHHSVMLDEIDFRGTVDTHVSHLVVARVFDGKYELREKDKFSELRWFPLDQLPSPLFAPQDSFVRNGGIASLRALLRNF